jgi:hypothetical protein
MEWRASHSAGREAGSQPRHAMNRLLAMTLLLLAPLRAADTTLFLEQFTGGVYDNANWVTWHAPWGSLPTINLAGGSAAISISTRNGSCGIAHQVDLSTHQGKVMTLSGVWGGSATGGEAWVEVMFYQTASSAMTNLSSANFLSYDLGTASKIAIKHDSFGLPDTVWSAQTFEADASNNGITAGFGGLTQLIAQPYVVIAFKVGRFGTISGLDNIRLTVPADPAAEVVLDEIRFNGEVLEVAASGLDPNKSYLLRRTTDGENFTDVGSPLSGAEVQVFTDPAPPADVAPALYQVWEAGEP